MTAKTDVGQAPRLGCAQCGAAMNPVAVLLGPVCRKCCRKNQKAVTQ